MGGDAAPVVIRIELTDGNSGAVVAALEKSFQQLGAAGAAAGKQVQIGLAGVQAAAKEAVAATVGAAGATMPWDPTRYGPGGSAGRMKQLATATQEAARSAAPLSAEMATVVDNINLAYAGMGKVRNEALQTGAAIRTWREAAAASTPGMAGAVMPGGAAVVGTGLAAGEAQHSAKVDAEMTAMRRYEALIKGTAAQQAALGAAFDAAQASGLGFTESVMAAVAALDAENAAAKGARASTLGMGQAYGESRIAMGAMSGSLGMMESGLARVLASSKALAPLMNAMFDVTMIGAGVGMIAMMADGAYNLYEKWLDVGAAEKQYDQQLEKTRFESFGNTHSIEETTQRIKEAAGAVREFREEAEQAEASALRAGGGGPHGALGVLNPYFDWEVHQAKTARDQQYKYQTALDKLQQQQFGAQHQQILDAIRVGHMAAPGASAEEKALLRYQEEVETNLEDQKWAEAQSGEQGNSKVAAAGRAHQQAMDTIAKQQMEDDLYGIRKQHAQELERLQEQAREASLHGIELLKAQESDALQRLKDEDIDSIKARQAVHDLFHAKELNYLADEQREMAKMGRDATSAGMAGIAKIQFDAETQRQYIRSDPNHHANYKSAALNLLDAQTNAQIAAAEQTFTDRISALSKEQMERNLTGFARIRAEEQDQIAQLTSEFQAQYGTDPTNHLYKAHAGQLRQGIGIYQSMGDQQTADLARKNEQETEQIEAQARIRMMSAEKQQTAAIELEYEERVRKYQDALSQQQISQEDFNRRVAAAQEEMNAQMVEQARQAREKIAGELRGLMGPHPLQALEEMGTKFASQAGASLLQRGARHYGINMEGGTASFFDKLAGSPHAGAPAWHPGAHGTPTSTAIAHAEIHVDEASIYTGGGSGARTPSGGTIGSGSTWMIGPGHAGSFGGGTAGMTMPGAHITSAGTGLGTRLSGAGAWVGSNYGGSTGGTPVGMPPPKGLGFMGVAQDTVAGAQTTLSIANMIHGGQPGAAGQTTGAGQAGTGLGSAASAATSKSAYQQSMIGGGMSVSNTVGAASAGLGLFSAHKEGGMGGTLGGAMSGAELGMEVGGPVGAAIGAVAGAAIGFFGGGEQARVWWLKQGQPRLYNDMDAFQQGSMDYLSAYMDMEQLDTTAKHTLKAMGFAGSRYYSDTVEGQIRSEIDKLTREQKAGRSASTFSSAMYSTGTDSVPAMLTPGERVISAPQNERITRALEAGADSPRMAPAAQGGDVNLHFHSVDAKGARDLLMSHSATIRAALNESYGDYGGLSDLET